MLIVLWAMCAAAPSYGFAIFPPPMVKGMEYSRIQANLMVAPPVMAGAVAFITYVWFSDYFHEQFLHIGIVTSYRK